MAKKICTKCLVKKDLNDFHCNKRYSDGRNLKCKICAVKASRLYYNSEKELAYNNTRRESQKEYLKWFRLLTTEQKSQLSLDRREAIDKIAISKKLMADERKSISLKTKEERRLKSIQRNADRQIQKSQTKIRRQKERAELYKHRYHNDPIFKLKEILKKRSQKIFKRNGWATPERCGKLLGTDFETVKLHIESKFVPGMSWMNHGTGDGYWHIDHIIPLDSAKKEPDVYALFHYTNLQPLWGADNIRKSNNIINF